ncbi:glycosyltransferase family 39 protein, partial [Lapillicoccus sp.]|uniref:ArnT family glycosyltransferase n=1 Tax=Lapillicoccus sp. TaxID=1909287 RepID=UPI0025D084CA
MSRIAETVRREQGTGVTRAPLARRPVGAAMVALAVVLTATSGGYGYHRDELYFRMLVPAWGYLDQPALTPLLARTMAAVVDQPWAMRVPATLICVATVLLVALITREVGGGARAQGLAAWGYAFAAFPLVFGHLLLTVTVDLLAWQAVTLRVIRAVLRDDGRAWLWAGVVAGAATWNKLLLAGLVVALVAGLLTVGPRRLPWRWLLAGAVAGLVIASPNLVYQATNGWPQLAMGRALVTVNSGARAQVVPFLGLLLGPPLVVVWGAGWWALLRRPEWRRIRFLAVAFPVLVVLALVSSGQVYYPPPADRPVCRGLRPRRRRLESVVDMAAGGRRRQRARLGAHRAPARARRRPRRDPGARDQPGRARPGGLAGIRRAGGPRPGRPAAARARHRDRHHGELRGGRGDRPLRDAARAAGAAQRPQRAVGTTSPAAHAGHRRRRRQGSAPGRPDVRDVHGGGDPRRRGRRPQRGAGSAGRR